MPTRFGDNQNISAETFTQLQSDLPEVSQPELSLDDQARGVLRLLLPPGPSPRPASPTAFQCPSCDAPATSLSSPYCSDKCKSTAGFIRQLRAAIASNNILTAERQIVFGERLWWLLGGGLPIRESRITEGGKRQVTKRSEGKCAFCGEPMAMVENHGSGCNRPFNLRAVCVACSKTKAFGDAEFCSSPAVVRVLDEIRMRVHSERPLRPCDDPDHWDWRAYVAQRKG